MMTEKPDRPLVSVIIPAYNARKYIERTLDSVLAQTYENLEILVIDDCSRDNTRDIVKSYSERDSRITLLCNEVNRGVAYARNSGLDRAEGDYVALLDADDIWLPTKIEKQVECAQRTGADIVYCSYSMIGEEGTVIRKNFIVPTTVDFDTALVKSVMSCSTVLLNREIAKEYRFDTSYYHEDLVLWLQLLKNGYKASGLTEVLASYRVSEQSRAADKKRAARERYHIYRNFCEYSALRSLALLCVYGALGFKKYGNMGGKRSGR